MIHDDVISDLRLVPQFLPYCADRIWHAWWQSSGHPLSYISDLLQDNLTDNVLPTAFVAHRGAEFLGTVSLIASDMDCRPQYSPWVAALWVDEQYRAQGIGKALLEQSKRAAFQAGFRTVYLCATADKHAYYAQRGWQLIEENVDGLNIYHQQHI